MCVPLWTLHLQTPGGGGSPVRACVSHVFLTQTGGSSPLCKKSYTKPKNYRHLVAQHRGEAPKPKASMKAYPAEDKSLVPMKMMNGANESPAILLC